MHLLRFIDLEHILSNANLEPLRSQIVKILGFEGHVVSITSTQFCLSMIQL